MPRTTTTIGKGAYSLSSSQQSTLEGIANQCPYTGGKAVLRARGLLTMLGVESQYNDGSNCQPAQQLEGNYPSVSTANQQIGAKLFPNPTKEHFTLVLDAPIVADAELVLMNSFGQTVLVRSLEAKLQNFDFNVADLATGVYFLSVKEGNNQLFTTRLVVLK